MYENIKTEPMKSYFMHTQYTYIYINEYIRCRNEVRCSSAKAGYCDKKIAGMTHDAGRHILINPVHRFLLPT